MACGIDCDIREQEFASLLNPLSVLTQWLIYNDCVFRTRHLYEYVMFHDRDEFAHFVGLAPQKVNLMAALDQLFGGRDVAGITYWGALYHTHCHMQTVTPCSGSCSVSIQHCL